MKPEPNTNSPQMGVKLIKNRKLKERLRMQLESTPLLYLNLLRLSRRGTKFQKLIVAKDTQIVIEGYPRSANSFARSAFMKIQPNVNDIKVATHTHSPAQIIQAARWGLPTMVMLRDPIGAMRGTLAYGLQLGTIPELTLAQVNRIADRYIWFYESIEPYRDKYFVARFDDVISDYAAVTKRFIERFNLTLIPYDPVVLPQSQVFEKKSHIGPSEEREKIKKEVETKLDKLLDDDRLVRAHAIYEHLGKD